MITDSPQGISADNTLTTALSALDAIDRLLGNDPVCGTCGEPLADGPSSYFCSEECQSGWHTNRTAPEWPTEDVPATGRPEVPPTRPLTWLGTRQGEAVLNRVTDFVRRFSAFPSQHCAPVLALWYAHTYIAEKLYVTPRLILDSAEPGSGKTRVLEVAQYLVAAPEMTLSASPAALVRMVSEGPITILFDEVDTVFTKAGTSNEDLRAMLNAGYKRSATIPRYDAKARSVRRFPVYAPAVLAGIAGGMPATITTRAITIHMRRRRSDERVEAFRERTVEQQSEPIREALTAWMAAVGEQVANAEPDMPEGVTDRAAEIWEPLIAIADAAGGHWPTTARNACRHFVLANVPPADSIGIQLLSDLQEIFSALDTDRVSTKDLLAILLTMEDGPWSELPDRPLDARRLSRELGRYGVKPVVFDTGHGKAKGYATFATTGKQTQVGLADAWSRYLPSPPETANCSNNAGGDVTETTPVTDFGFRPSHARLGNGYCESTSSRGTGNPLSSAVTTITTVGRGRE